MAMNVLNVGTVPALPKARAVPLKTALPLAVPSKKSKRVQAGELQDALRLNQIDFIFSFFLNLFFASYHQLI